MATFDLKGIKAGKYVNTAGTITYTDVTAVGDAISANIELKFAEGRLYAESALAEYMKSVTGGTISLGVKYIKPAAKTLLYGMTAGSRTVSGSTVASELITSSTESNYVGVGFYAPDKIDGVTKYVAVFVHKALFGPPAMSFATKGDSITFQTPTTTGEFMASDATGKNMLEVTTCATEADAVAWIAACLV